jgi:sigma-B regulation protein RsbU (phosphoserine phosphatase)
VQGDDELGSLARAFNSMVPELQAGIHMRGALSLAHEVQRNLLPAAPPDFPGLDVAGVSISADETGGDYFDFLDLRPFGDDRLAVAIGDVVGHGVAAALLMAGARANLRSRARPLGDLDALIEGVNRLIHEDVADGKFMTLLFLVFDPRNSSAHWVDAGHGSPLHFHAKGGEISETASSNIPLGIMPEWKYKRTPLVELKVGDVLLLSTDGVWEARNPQGEFFGTERLGALLREHHEQTSDEIIAVIKNELDAFQAGHPFGDDVTIVALKRTEA